MLAMCRQLEAGAIAAEFLGRFRVHREGTAQALAPAILLGASEDWAVRRYLRIISLRHRADVRATMDARVKELERCIRNDLKRLRKRIKDGDESKLAIWVIPGELACSQRPLRDHPRFGGRTPLPPEARPLVAAWVDWMINEFRIKSVICLLEETQLDRYYVRGGLGLDERGLLGYYESRGLEVRHFPMIDYQRPAEDQMRQVLAAFDELPKPVLLHCSAAIDRTTPVAAFIAFHRGKGSETKGVS